MEEEQASSASLFALCRLCPSSFSTAECPQLPQHLADLGNSLVIGFHLAAICRLLASGVAFNTLAMRSRRWSAVR